MFNILFQIPNKTNEIPRLGIINIFKHNKNINYFNNTLSDINIILEIIEKKSIDAIVITNKVKNNILLHIKKIYPKIIIGYYLHGIYGQYQIPPTESWPLFINYWCDFDIIERFYKNNSIKFNIYSINSLPSIDYIFYLKNNLDTLKNKFIKNNNINILYLTSHIHFDKDNRYLKEIIESCYLNNYNLIIILHPRKRNNLHKKISRDKMNIKSIWSKSIEFIDNNITIGSNEFLYEYMVLSDLLICPTTSSVTIQAIAGNINTLFYATPNDVKSISQDSNLSTINSWNSKNKYKYDVFLLDKYKIKIIELKEIFNINNFINKYLTKTIKSYTNIEKDNIMKHFFNNTNFSENTSSEKILSDIQSLLA